MRRTTEPTATVSLRLALSEAQAVADLARARGGPGLSSILRELVVKGLAATDPAQPAQPQPQPDGAGGTPHTRR